MGILDKIISAKKDRIKNQKKILSLESLKNKKLIYDNFFPLENLLNSKNILISEMKRQSPSGGSLDQDLDPKEQAEMYIRSGSDAISVLTEEDFFKGHNNDLNKVLKISKNKKVPVLQKDFIIDEYQIYLAKNLGADCILLITRILSREQYIDFYKLASSIGLSVIVEIFDQKELDFALETDIKILGINNRNLDTLKTELENFEKISPLVPGNIFKIAESGIKNSLDAKRMIEAGANGLLVGESIMRSKDRTKIIKEISLNE
ncbi:MAG: indole-3-glycerol phosphate synthase [Chloroflexi bacterium]|nr:indole-3-glycerol phosphate synthase [Chloroflexota bacterium]|tara:strand:+ start:1335 stop:2120 length:786 start_codon:yes stop_codon:yes gene_type:complete